MLEKKNIRFLMGNFMLYTTILTQDTILDSNQHVKQKRNKDLYFECRLVQYTYGYFCFTAPYIKQSLPTRCLIFVAHL